ncbi:TIGR03619 family F420-dependent LLM class oxidoreductase [Microbispora catharanthi]|uniref:TIGR03619 family F420-dependent LLM class oxidoreductase n=1 Tax=Microbispora catharanthi TaxID=1712871 RepID=A0A5N6BB90_9ACTN|nr:TIGR03619 family F420-dependent LLM class oxidoreductase [Microbispora catharanthi]KAB8178327.1 TIGR03619 family F420-dependent LLM class oxidoreductase [Microbispora catharanthi]
MPLTTEIARAETAPPAIGLFALNGGETVEDPADMRDIARLAEDAGYDSLWMGEHPVMPVPPPPGGWFHPGYVLNDPLITLSHLAALTSTIRLCTGVMLLPLRNPVITAKQVATLDRLSGGRFTLGFGMGYIRAQADAVGVAFRGRADRGREHLEAMRALWYDEPPVAYHGAHVDFSGVESFPRPVQADLPLVAGGHSDKALRLAITHAHGWFAFGLPPAHLEALLMRLRDIARTVERPARLGPLSITVSPPRGGIDKDIVEAYRRLGVDRLVLWAPPNLGARGLTDYVRRNAAHISSP